MIRLVTGCMRVYEMIKPPYLGLVMKYVCSVVILGSHKVVTSIDVFMRVSFTLPGLYEESSNT